MTCIVAMTQHCRSHQASGAGGRLPMIRPYLKPRVAPPRVKPTKASAASSDGLPCGNDSAAASAGPPAPTTPPRAPCQCKPPRRAPQMCAWRCGPPRTGEENGRNSKAGEGPEAWRPTGPTAEGLRCCCWGQQEKPPPVAVHAADSPLPPSPPSSCARNKETTCRRDLAAPEAGHGRYA